MAFHSDFSVPWWAQGSRYPQVGPHAHAYHQDPYHISQQYPSEFHPSRPSTQLWPEGFSPHHEPPRHLSTYHGERPERYSRASYPRDLYERYMHDDEEPGLLGSTFSRRHDDRHRPALQSQSGQARPGRSDQYLDTLNLPTRSHSPHTAPRELHLEDLLGLRPTSRASNKPPGAFRRAGSPTVWSVHSLAQHDSDGNEEDEDAQPLDLERDRLQQLKKRQQLQDLQLKQQMLQEQQQQALQEQRRREALLERELQGQRELQRRRAAEHHLEQQQQEALLAALQQQRRRQQQKLQEQERRLAQQRQAEQQAELERRMQQLWQAHLQQQQQRGEVDRKQEAVESEELQFEDAQRQALERQKAQRAQQAAKQAQQAAQQGKAEQMAQHAQQAELEREQQTQKAVQQAFAEAAQRAQQHELHKQAQQAQHAQQHKQKPSRQLPEAKLKGPMFAVRRPLTPDEAASCIQSHYKGYRMRSEKPMLTALGKANHKLAQIFSRLYQVESCITALQAKAQPKAQQGAAVKLRHHHGKCGSPEQLQKQLVELSELSMQVVLSMDELHSDRSEVHIVRKQVVKKALALMERIDNVRAGMLRSLLDASHPHDQAASQTPPQTPQQEQSLAATPDARQEALTNQLPSARKSFKATEGPPADALTEQQSIKETEALAADTSTDDSTEQHNTSGTDFLAAGTLSDTHSNVQPDETNFANTTSVVEKIEPGTNAEGHTDDDAGHVMSNTDADIESDVIARLSGKATIDEIGSGDASTAGQNIELEGEEDGSVQDLAEGTEGDD